MLVKHSGLQPKYGSPWYSLKHVQTPSLHCALGPHGEGLQGSDGISSETKNNIFGTCNYDDFLEISLSSTWAKAF